MSDRLEDDLHAARGRLPLPDEAATARARDAALSATSARPGRRRTLVLAAGIALAVAAAFAAGFGVRSTGAAPAPAVAAPATYGAGFLPAPGWNTTQPGITAPPQAPTAIAANVPIDPADGNGSYPQATLAGLPRNGVVIAAGFYPRGEVAAVDRSFPPAKLPLDLGEARQMGRMEGQPNAVGPRRLLVSANGYNLQVDVYFGSRRPSAALVAAGAEELRGLVLPTCPAAVTGGSDAVGSAVAFMRNWLIAHWDPRRPQNIANARLQGWPASEAPHAARIRVACPSRWRQSVEVDVTLPRAARANTGPAPLVYFLARTPAGWTIWHQG